MNIDKNTPTIGFEKMIWDAACVPRGHMTTSDYQKVVFALLFLKYINDQLEKKYNELLELLIKYQNFIHTLTTYRKENDFIS